MQICASPVEQTIDKINWFLNVSSTEIATLTQTDKARWTRYFDQTAISDRSLSRFGARLNMQPELLLHAIRLRRRGLKSVPSDSWLMSDQVLS